MGKRERNYQVPRLELYRFQAAKKRNRKRENFSPGRRESTQSCPHRMWRRSHEPRFHVARHRRELPLSVPCFSSLGAGIPGQAGTRLPAAAVVFGSVFFPRPVPAVGWTGAGVAKPVWRLDRWCGAGGIPRSRGRAALVVAGGGGDRVERLLCLLGTPATASRAVAVALSLGASQCRASRLAGGASGASAGYRLHDGADQFAGLRAGLSAGDAGRLDRVPGDLGDLHSLERTPADRTAAVVRRCAGTSSLASRSRARRGELREYFAADGSRFWDLPLSRSRAGGVRRA